MASDPHSVNDILDALEHCAQRNDKVSLGDAVAAFGHRGYAPFLILPALIDISPLGSIPGVPTMLAVIIVTTAVQMALGREHLWLPAVLRRRSVRSDRLCKAVAKLRGVAGFMDRWFHGRLPALTRGPFTRIAAVAVIALAFTIPPLELVPFATTAPMLAIAAFGIALLVRDGVLMIVATVLAAGAVALGVGALVSRGGG